MNYPKQQARKALLKKLIYKRTQQLSNLEDELSYCIYYDLNHPKISILAQSVKVIKKEIKILSEIAKENKKDFSEKVSLFRSTSGKIIFDNCYFK